MNEGETWVAVSRHRCWFVLAAILFAGAATWAIQAPRYQAGSLQRSFPWVEVHSDEGESRTFKHWSGSADVCKVCIVARLEVSDFIWIIPRPILYTQECRVISSCADVQFSEIPIELSRCYSNELNELGSRFPPQSQRLWMGRRHFVLWDGVWQSLGILALWVLGLVSLCLGARRWALIKLRLSRHTAGQCRKCGYPVASGDRCPECGAIQPH